MSREPELDTMVWLPGGFPRLTGEITGLEKEEEKMDEASCTPLNNLARQHLSCGSLDCPEEDEVC